MNDELIELKAVFFGKVQKVGFRWTVVAAAEAFQLTGTVKNLSNGSVEVYAVGTRDNLEKFLTSLQGEKSPIKIDKIERSFYSNKQKFTEFKIIY